MSVLRFFSSRLFFKHLLLAIGLVGLLSFGALKALDVYARHGESVVMPDLRGLLPDDFEAEADVHSFKFVVIDSVFEPSMPGGAVFSQDPAPGSQVKRHRKVYLTLVARAKETVGLPDLSDFTLRQARAMLETYGLTIDSLVFVPDLGMTVVKMLIAGEEASPGTQVEKGTAVSLVVGMGKSNERVVVPLLLGKTPDEAHGLLSESSLNTGAEFFPPDYEEADLVVVRQRPTPKPGLRIPMGTPIDLWFAPAAQFDYDQALLQIGIDSLTLDQLKGDTLEL